MRRRTGKAVACCIAALLVTAGCGKSAAQALAHDAEAFARRAAANAERLPDGALRPRDVPKAVIPAAAVGEVSQQVDERAAQLLERYADDLSTDELSEVVAAACKAKDLYELGLASSWEAAAGQAVVSFGGAATRRERVQDLAQDLNSAENSTDYVETLASFAICEAVG